LLLLKAYISYILGAAKGKAYISYILGAAKEKKGTVRESSGQL
jgi:hypothetical protein